MITMVQEPLATALRRRPHSRVALPWPPPHGHLEEIIAVPLETRPAEPFAISVCAVQMALLRKIPSRDLHCEGSWYWVAESAEAIWAMLLPRTPWPSFTRPHRIGFETVGIPNPQSQLEATFNEGSVRGRSWFVTASIFQVGCSSIGGPTFIRELSTRIE